MDKPHVDSWQFCHIINTILQYFSNKAMSLAHSSSVLSKKIHHDLIVYNQMEGFTIACHVQGTSSLCGISIFSASNMQAIKHTESFVGLKEC